MLSKRARPSADLAVDLGSTHVRLVARGKGVLLEIPTVVATAPRARGREVVAVGEAAKKMLGRTPPGTQVILPVRGGVVADFEATEQLLRHLLREGVGRSLRKPRVLICIPFGTTEVERRAVQESARAAGAGEVTLAATTLCAAIGAELPVSEPVGNVIVDVGGGRVEAGVTSLGGLVVKRSLELAGDALDDAIQQWLRRHRNLLIGVSTAQRLKHHIGSLTPESDGHLRMRIRGRDLATGRPEELEISVTDISEALAEPSKRIRKVVLELLQQTPPELSADIIDRGILVCGGSSHLRGLVTLISEDCGLPVLQAEQPDRCVALGAATLLDDPALFARVTATI